MCLSKTPSVQTPPPVARLEEAKPEDEATRARQDERRRLKGAINSRTTMLSSGTDSNGRKTLLGI